MNNMDSYGRYVGQVFDNRYQILKILGVGGMAIVFEAYDFIEKRNVAIKMLKDDIANDVQQVKRFINESKAVAMLSHPNIVKIYDMSMRGSTKFIVMEYIEGITLKDYMTRKGVLSFNEIIGYSEQILHALEHAHSKGVVHRDIKPQNIMLLKNGVVKVTDFGIAKLPNAETLTISDKAIGTVFYISPEQAEGRAIDQRSDLYSLGIMMYEMSCGRLPFYDESPISVALMQINKQPAPLRTINPAVPRGLEQIIMSSIEKNVDLRFQSASQMLRQIMRLKSDPGIVFKPNPKVEALHRKENKKNNRTSNRAKEETTMLPIILGVVLALLCAIIFSVFMLLQSDMFSSITGKSNSPTTVVPKVVGQLYFEGCRPEDIGASSKHYELEVKWVNDNESEKGRILSQNPSAGNKIKLVNGEKKTLKITVSLGSQMITLENYEGYTERNAKNAISSLGLRYKIERISSNVQKKGYVCFTDPAAGGTITEGGTVVIYISTGASSGDGIEVISFVGQTENTAKEMAEQMGLSVNIEYEKSDMPGGQVIRQSLEVGEFVAHATFITFTVSEGKEGNIGKQVPDITGKTVKEAQIILQRYGLTLGTRSEKTGNIAENLILEQSPKAGAEITDGLKKINYTICIGKSSGNVDSSDDDDNDNDNTKVEFFEIDGYRVPNIIGKTVSKAKTLLRQYELELGTGTTVRSPLAAGVIISISVSYDENNNAYIDYVKSGGPNY